MESTLFLHDELTCCSQMKLAILSRVYLSVGEGCGGGVGGGGETGGKKEENNKPFQPALHEWKC